VGDRHATARCETRAGDDGAVSTLCTRTTVSTWCDGPRLCVRGVQALEALRASCEAAAAAQLSDANHRHSEAVSQLRRAHDSALTAAKVEHGGVVDRLVVAKEAERHAAVEELRLQLTAAFEAEMKVRVGRHHRSCGP
jgi:hypothetical protein